MKTVDIDIVLNAISEAGSKYSGVIFGGCSPEELAKLIRNAPKTPNGRVYAYHVLQTLHDSHTGRNKGIRGANSGIKQIRKTVIKNINET